MCVLQFCNKLHAVGTRGWVTGGFLIWISLMTYLYFGGLPNLHFICITKTCCSFYYCGPLLLQRELKVYPSSSPAEFPPSHSCWPPLLAVGAGFRCWIWSDEMSDHCSYLKRSCSEINTWTCLCSCIFQPFVMLPGPEHWMNSNIYSNFHLKTQTLEQFHLVQWPHLSPCKHGCT